MNKFVEQCLVSVNPDGGAALSSLKNALGDIETSLRDIHNFLIDQSTHPYTPGCVVFPAQTTRDEKPNVAEDFWNADLYVMDAAVASISNSFENLMIDVPRSSSPPPRITKGWKGTRHIMQWLDSPMTR